MSRGRPKTIPPELQRRGGVFSVCSCLRRISHDSPVRAIQCPLCEVILMSHVGCAKRMRMRLASHFKCCGTAEQRAQYRASEKLAVARRACECGNAGINGICASCRAIDAEPSEADIRHGSGVAYLVSALRTMGGVATMDALVLDLDVHVRSVWRALSRLHQAGRIDVLVNGEPREYGPRPKSGYARRKNCGSVRSRWSVMRWTGNGESAEDLIEYRLRAA